MAYEVRKNIRHDGKKFAIGETFPTTGVEKKDIERLETLGAIVDPDAEKKAIARAEAEKKKKAEAGE